MYVRLGSESTCLGIGDSGNVLLTSANAPYNAFSICDSSMILLIDAYLPYCGSDDTGYSDALNFTIVSPAADPEPTTTSCAAGQSPSLPSECVIPTSFKSRLLVAEALCISFGRLVITHW